MVFNEPEYQQRPLQHQKDERRQEACCAAHIGTHTTPVGLVKLLLHRFYFTEIVTPTVPSAASSPPAGSAIRDQGKNSYTPGAA